MAKIVFETLKSKPDGNGKSNAVTEKRVDTGDGQIKTLRTLDIGSRTFGDDLQYVFSKNVAKARRDNRRVIGTTDVVVNKR